MMSDFIENKILIELLLEGGFNPFEEDNYVDYVFEEIALETQIKKENHEINKYQSNVTNYHEARRRMGMKDESDDDEQLFNRKITDESTLRQIDRTAEHQLELARVNNAAKATTGSSSGGTKKASSAGTKKTRITKDKGPSGRVDSIDRPKNQYGTHSVKMKEAFEDKTVLENSLEYKAILNIYNDLKNDIKSNEIKRDIYYEYALELLVRKTIQVTDKYSIKGISDAIYEINKLNNTDYKIPTDKIDLTEFYKEIRKSLSNILVDIDKTINNKNLDDIFDDNEYRLLYLLDYIQRKVYWYSYIKAGALMGVSNAYILFNSKSDKENHKIKIETDNFSLDDVPSYHSFCDCRITYNKHNKGGE
jgi:hypothetical protein